METKAQLVWNKLKQQGEITSIEIIDITNTTCPHGIIRQLRKRYGYAYISDEWQQKTKKVIGENGKTQKVTVRYKRYFLDELGAIA